MSALTVLDYVLLAWDRSAGYIIREQDKEAMPTSLAQPLRVFSPLSPSFLFDEEVKVFVAPLATSK